MLSFQNDYSEGAHPAILDALIRTNLVQQVGYGEDDYCVSARKKIAEACGAPDAQVVFISGGTQVNAIAIDNLLRPYEGALCAVTGHINGHEAGAIEFTGHKCLALPHTEGKVSAADVKKYCQSFYADGTYPHMVHPGMLYISHPTEYGTLYTLDELKALRAVCDEYHLPIYMDGARLGYGLMSPSTDVTLKDIAALMDAFTIGGTKVGALCGEALVFPKGNMPRGFITITKQRGAMMAKGRLMGVQFDTLFTDDLYLRCGEAGIRQAMRLKSALLEKGYTLHMDSPTNQQFVLLDDAQLARLEGKVLFSVWERPDDTHTVIRLATSWATTDEMMDSLIALL